MIAEVTSTGASVSPSASSSLRRSFRQSSTCSAVSVSAWLSTTVVTEAWPASGTRYRRCTEASAYFSGSSTQTSMSAILTSRSTKACEPVTTESWSGRSSSSSPVSDASPSSSALARAYRCRRCTLSQSSRGAAPSMPHTQACECLVVGRITPAGEKEAPARALNSEDLPLPVPPARATTVCVADIRSRSPDRRSSVSASASSSGLNPSDPDLADPTRVSSVSAASLAGRRVTGRPVTPIVFAVT